MSIKQPAAIVGFPHVKITVVRTGDPEIDRGVEACLRRVRGIDLVTRASGSGDTDVYALGFDEQMRVGELHRGVVVALEAHYVSYGMNPTINIVNDL